jgi:hypothetical protein
MSPAMQLIIGPGDPVPLDAPRPRGLSAGEREIIRVARQQGGISPALAGRIRHSHSRGHSCRPGTGACCATAVVDGERSLRRLRSKGLMARVRPDRWIVADVQDPRD